MLRLASAAVGKQHAMTSAAASLASNEKPRRRWLQFGLRSLLLLITVFGVWFGLYIKRVRRQKEAVQAIREFGGWVHYDFQETTTLAGTNFDSRIEPPLPKWLVDRLGEDFFFNVAEVNLVYNDDGGRRLDNANVAATALEHLAAFPKLRVLLVKETQATDDGLRTVGQLKRLTHLYMWDASQVTDAGIAHLAGLANLRKIHIGHSQIGDESLKVLAALAQLDDMSLQGNRFSDRGLAYLKDCDNLRELWVGIGPTSITDAGMPSLALIKNLELLDLQNTRVTSAGLEHLSSLTKLKSLYLSGTKADSPKLRQALPNCKIVH
jgi:hypothetical protein